MQRITVSVKDNALAEVLGSDDKPGYVNFQQFVEDNQVMRQIKVFQDLGHEIKLVEPVFSEEIIAAVRKDAEEAKAIMAKRSQNESV